MKSLITEGIVLSRTNYGEADRILTILTPDQGKLRLMAKGVRKVKSKLAGGIELFSVSELSYISGKNDIGTLVSTRLKTHYGHIIEDMDRVQLGYELLKAINRITEDHLEDAYFDLLNESFEALNDFNVDISLVAMWFGAQMIKINGHKPNLSLSLEGQQLKPDEKYRFDLDNMGLEASSRGLLEADHIKVMRLLFSNFGAKDIEKIDGVLALLPELKNVIRSIVAAHLPQIQDLIKAA